MRGFSARSEGGGLSEGREEGRVIEQAKRKWRTRGKHGREKGTNATVKEEEKDLNESMGG